MNYRAVVQAPDAAGAVEALAKLHGLDPAPKLEDLAEAWSEERVEWPHVGEANGDLVALYARTEAERRSWTLPHAWTPYAEPRNGICLAWYLASDDNPDEPAIEAGALFAMVPQRARFLAHPVADLARRPEGHPFKARPLQDPDGEPGDWMIKPEPGELDNLPDGVHVGGEHVRYIPHPASADDVHAQWTAARKAGRKLPHPLEAMVRTWTPAPKRAEAVARPDAILAGPFIQTHARDKRIGSLAFQPFAHLAPAPEGVLYLPGFGTGEEHGEPVSASLPLSIWTLGSGDHRSPAAALALRVVVDFASAVPLLERGGRLRFEETLYDLWRRHYPGAKRPHPSQLRRLREALHHAHNLRIAHRDPETGAGGDWSPFAVRNIPHVHAAARVVVDIELPPGSDRGIIHDRAAGFRVGPASGTAFRLLLSLEAHWAAPGRMRFKVGRGRGRPWKQARNIKRYPRVSDAELLAWTYPAGHNRRRADALRQAAQALARLEAAGLVRVGPERRIMPGDNWAGWGAER